VQKCANPGKSGKNRGNPDLNFLRHATIPKIKKAGVFTPPVFFYVFTDEFQGEFGHFFRL
jgi:hypothetical protein